MLPLNPCSSVVSMASVEEHSRPRSPQGSIEDNQDAEVRLFAKIRALRRSGEVTSAHRCLQEPYMDPDMEARLEAMLERGVPPSVIRTVFRSESACSP
jgi:hypothetical protein